MNKLLKGNTLQTLRPNDTTFEFVTKKPRNAEQHARYLAYKEMLQLKKTLALYPKHKRVKYDLPLSVVGMINTFELRLGEIKSALKNRDPNSYFTYQLNNNETFRFNVKKDYTLRDRLEIIRSLVNEALSQKRMERANRKLVAKKYSAKDMQLSFFSSCKNSSAEGRTFNVTDKSFYTYKLNMVGTVNRGLTYYEPLSILKLQEANKVKKIFESKVPLTKEHHLGIEIEFFCDLDRDELAQELVSINKYLNLKSDGSINAESGKHPHELVICVPQSMREEIVTKVCEVLKRANAKINKSCGLHVHLDMRNRDRELAFANLVAAQNILYDMQPASRKENARFCKRDNERSLKEAIRSSDRYRGINPLAWEKHKTIEVRMHSGTVNGEKINNWISLLEHIANTSKYIDTVPRKLSTFKDYYSLPEKLVEYVGHRISKFEHDPREEVGAE